MPCIFVDTIDDKPKKSLRPAKSGSIIVLSCDCATSGGIFPKAIRSLRRNNSFVEKFDMAFGRSKPAADNFTLGIGRVQ